MAWGMTWTPFSPRMGLMTDLLSIAALQTENARLVALLEAHGIAWRLSVAAVPAAVALAPPPRLGTDAKVALFRRLFRGRTDV